MSTWLWIAVVVAVVVVAIAILSSVIRRRRSEVLRTGFGPEYDRTVERTGDRSAAEADLRDRQRRHDELELRPLAPLARKGFIDAWQGNDGTVARLLGPSIDTYVKPWSRRNRKV